MEKEFRASPQFQKLTFHIVKNERLVDAYKKDQFPADAAWLFELYQSKSIRRPGRPGWQFYVDQTLIETFEGSKGWNTNHLPRIKELVDQYSQ